MLLKGMRTFAENGVDQKTEYTHKQAKKGKFWISDMVGNIDKLVKKKYTIPLDKRKNVKIPKGKRPGIMHRYFASIWRLYLAPQKTVLVPDPLPRC